MDRTPPRVETPTPEAGADSDAILADLGYSAERIRALRDAGVV
jgi:crotonobetainyl-CoA:carnitine CoA-transferase CaiB-like acyl-CoA transferase